MSLVTDTYELRAIDEYKNDIRRIFQQTFFMGKPFLQDIDNFSLYEGMSLDWYLNESPECSAVFVETQSEQVVGYVLVCTRPADYNAWINREARKVFFSNFFSFVTFRMSRNGIHFYSRRVVDALLVSRRRKSTNISELPHVHMNLLPSARSGILALQLLSFADDVCRRSGNSLWVGEINAPIGKRRKAIEKFVGEVIDSVPNRTSSFFLGTQVRRLTVRRYVSDCL